MDDAIAVLVTYVYILRCVDDRLYVGFTEDLHARLARHQDGKASAFTAARRPVTLVFTETYATRESAAAREQQIKRWSRAKKEALIAGDLALLKRL